MATPKRNPSGKSDLLMWGSSFSSDMNSPSPLLKASKSGAETEKRKKKQRGIVGDFIFIPKRGNLLTYYYSAKKGTPHYCLSKSVFLQRSH